MRVERALALLIWAVLWHLRFDGAASSPWAAPRLVLALLLFSVPGILAQRLILGEAAGRFTRQVTLGFALSVTLTGSLGLMASLLRLPFTFVDEGIFVAGAVLLLVAPRPQRPRFRVLNQAILQALPAIAATLFAARLAITPYASLWEIGDDATHTARIRWFASSSGLSFDDFIFGSPHLTAPRYWLSFWPLAKAVFITHAGLTPLELMSLYLSPLVAILALMALYELARTLGGSYRLANFVVVAQVACLLLTPATDQPGGVFFTRLAEDKAMAAFLIAPVFLRLLAEGLQSQGGRVRLALVLAGLSQIFAHPLILGITCVIAAAFVAIEFLFERQRAALLLLGLVLALPVLPASFRFTGLGAPQLLFSIADAEESPDFPGVRKKTLEVFEDGLYATSPRVYRNLPFAILAAGAAASAFRLRRSRMARLVLVASLVIATTFVPWTAWIMGKAVTPFMIWRVLWLTPFGLSAAVLVTAVGALKPRVSGFALDIAQMLALGLAGAYALSPERVPPLRPLPDDWRTMVLTYPQGEASKDSCRATFEDFRRLGSDLDSRIEGSAVAAGLGQVNGLLPGLSARVRPFHFRAEVQNRLHGSFSPQEAAERRADSWVLTGGIASPAERLRVLDRYHVRFLLGCGRMDWVLKTSAGAPDRIVQVSEFGPLRLFEVR